MMIFDQYSRYKACADLLYQTGFAAGDSVLDIGSGPECLSGQFIHDAKMTYLDPLIDNNSEDGYISGDIFTKSLDGRKFDCVIAVDVLEHVPHEHRQVFLERMSSLARDTLILGFPASDSSVAQDVDSAMEQKYRHIFDKEYSWLEEHNVYGLPSLRDTVDLLVKHGWYCQNIGHGYAPWLKQLLTFVIATWEIPGLKDVVMDVSEKFNRELYQYDYGDPCYRQFIVASRNEGLKLQAPGYAHNNPQAQKQFKELLQYAYNQYFSTSLRLLFEDKDIAQRMEEITDQRDAAINERDTVLLEKNTVVVERDKAIQYIDTIKKSSSWRLTRPLRFAVRLFHYGLLDEDRKYIGVLIRRRYHQLPIPVSAKKILSYIYHRIIGKLIRGLRRKAFSVSRFRPPAIKPAAKDSTAADYIVLGVIDWHFRKQRPQQIALELVKTGRRVFYVSPNLVDDDRAGFEIEALDASGRLFQVKLYASGAPLIYSQAPSVTTTAQLRLSIGEMLCWASCQQIISMVQHPFWCDVAYVLPNSRLVYDCMDYHEGFGNNGESLLELEKTLLDRSHITITTSTWLHDIVKPHVINGALIRNATDYEYFSSTPEKIYSDPEGRRIIGYYGAIAEWLDQDLVEAIAKEYPECCVLLIGADTANAKHRLGKLDNVSFTGEVPYQKVAYYLYAFDVCMLPFKIIPLTIATNPVKAYEYLSAGKPVVASDLPEMVQFDGLVRCAGNKQQFLEKVGEALLEEQSDDLIQSRKRYASGQTWAHRVEALIEQTEVSIIDPLISVIVVTYNNISFTRECLFSLEHYSQYDNLEIIVVDNASSDGTQDFISAWAAENDKRKIILNADNRGFAAANNQGLEIAKGDYLVMLNNDTYVTPGWARTLSQHLRRDGTIGLIGPVTNNIGNEAKIDIRYSDMGEMLIKSAEYTTRHIGQTCPLRTAAFFCVMMSHKTYHDIGPLDEAFGQGFFEDDDYCRRIEGAGLRVVCAEDVFIHHHLSATFDKLKQKDRQRLFETNKKIYEDKWGEWIPHDYRRAKQPSVLAAVSDAFAGHHYTEGQCNICGSMSRFFYQDMNVARESLVCEYCRSTSRYRSIARGILQAVRTLTGIEAVSIASLQGKKGIELGIYDTQPPFYYESCAYPVPDLLKKTGWIDVVLSQYKPDMLLGKKIRNGVTNQNLEKLTFDDKSFDIVITSDVMEHVRLDDLAHKEIYRILKPGGFYLFTVPHNRDWGETQIRVQINDPDDPSKDIHLLEPEYHGDTNNDDDQGVLSYRAYGRDLDVYLNSLGFDVEYTRTDIPHSGIINTELYLCRKSME